MRRLPSHVGSLFFNGLERTLGDQDAPYGDSDNGQFDTTVK